MGRDDGLEADGVAAPVAWVPARVLRIVVGSLAIEDGQVLPPTVGEVGRYTLTFTETELDPAGSDEGGVSDVTAGWVQARAEPLSGGFPRGPGQGWDGTPTEGATTWPTVLHGDGWSATWSAPRPVIGQVRVHGRLADQLSPGVDTGARGRVNRVQVVVDTVDTRDPDQRRWRPILEQRRLREVEQSPRWFDSGLIAADGASAGGWYSPVPGDPWVSEVGVLVDLDLDQVPALPLRPALVPGAVSAAGCDVWVADTRLPLVVRVRGALTDHPELTAYWWEGPILAGHSRPDGQGERVLHADPEGCWITGPDGVLRADLDGAVTLVSDRPAVLSAANGTTLAVQAPATHQGHAPLLVRLHRPTGAKVDVELPDHALTGLVGRGAGFLLMLRRGEQLGDPQPTDEDRRPWLAALDPTGGLRHGPPLALRGSWDQLVAADPPLVHDRGGNGRLRRVGDDLTLDDGAEMARTLLGVCGDAGRLWIAIHPPHPQDVAQRGAAACWPLKTPPTYPDDRQHWLLTELDPTGTPIVSTLVPAVVRHVTVDDTGTAWALADGVRHLPTLDGAPAEPLDLDGLLLHTPPS